MTAANRKVLIPVIEGLIVLVVLVAAWEPARALPQPTPSWDCPFGSVGATVQAAMTPEGAVCAVVQAGDSVYAGDCAATESPRDIGKVCSKYIAQRGSLRAYLIGRTFSEFSSWIFVEQRRDGWVLFATAPLDFAAASLVVPWPEHSVTPELSR